MYYSSLHCSTSMTLLKSSHAHIYKYSRIGTQIKAFLEGEPRFCWPTYSTSANVQTELEETNVQGGRAEMNTQMRK